MDSHQLHTLDRLVTLLRARVLDEGNKIQPSKNNPHAALTAAVYSTNHSRFNVQFSLDSSPLFERYFEYPEHDKFVSFSLYFTQDQRIKFLLELQCGYFSFEYMSAKNSKDDTRPAPITVNDLLEIIQHIQKNAANVELFAMYISPIDNTFNVGLHYIGEGGHRNYCDMKLSIDD